MKDSQQASRKLERAWVGGGYNVLQYRKWSRQMKKGQTQGRKSLPCERRSLQIDKQAKKELKRVRGLYAYNSKCIVDFSTKIQLLTETRNFPLTEKSVEMFETLRKA